MFFSCAGVLDNSFALLIFLSSKNLRDKLTNWYLINQSIVDMMALLFLLLHTITVTDDKVGSGIVAELDCRYGHTSVILGYHRNLNSEGKLT